MTYSEPVLLARKRLEAKISELIDMLDVLDGDPDLEDTGDDEPSLGSSVQHGADGMEYDLELDTSDDEPSLGWNLYGELGPTFDPDRELDDSDREPNGDETDSNFTEDGI